MTDTKYNTLINTLLILKENGVTSSFKVEKDKMKCLESGKTYTPKNMCIDEYFRFEGASNPSDMSILFSVECEDGNRGTIISSYGIHANTELVAFMNKVKTKENH
jgi:hypothetical protein